MNKNAYEIRLEVLQAAINDCQNKFSEKLNVIREQDYNERERLAVKRVKSDDGPFVAKLTQEKIDELFPSTAVVLKRAEELYAFIDR